MKTQQAKKSDRVVGIGSGKKDAKHMRRWRREKLRNVLVEKQGEELERRRVIDEDLFEGIYTLERLITPPYDFTRLYEIYEESDILQSAVEAMQQNVDGFGYQMQFLGDDRAEIENVQAQAEKTRSENFFDSVNEDQSFRTIRKLMREDLEVLGNGAFEVLRNRRQELVMVYHMPFEYVRMSALTGSATPVVVQVPRDGKVVSLRIKKYFRRWAQKTTSGRKVRWFKSFGDPRTMDATDGEYKPASACKLVASEIWHHKLAFGSEKYGLPRWIGAMMDVLGRRSAQFVNYDLFDSQGIPPMAIMVSGGVLTDESVEEIESAVRSLRGVGKWNRIMLLESNVETTGLEDKGTAKIELKNLNEFRKEDQQFGQYLTSSEKTVRHRWRLPALYVGMAETFTHATARAAQAVAEEQVFIPERIDFDEPVNRQILRQELGVTEWRYVSKGPRIVGPEEISKGVETFAKAGAFTVNAATEMANTAFGLEMSKFDQPWADYPLSLVIEMLKLGMQLKGTEKIGSTPTPTPPVVPKALPVPVQKTLPLMPEKVLKSDMFSEEEQGMYRTLVAIQAALERAGVCDVGAEL